MSVIENIDRVRENHRFVAASLMARMRDNGGELDKDLLNEYLEIYGMRLEQIWPARVDHVDGWGYEDEDNE